LTFLDLIQVYNLQNNKELNDIASIFADIDIDSRIDKQVLATSILDECGAMRCIYNTSSTFKIFSDNFFKKYKDNITKILDAMEVEYGPLESINFNWTETTQISQNLDTDENTTEDRTRTNNDSETTTNTGTIGDSGNVTEEDTISAMNDSNYQPDSHKTTNNSNTRTNNLTENIIDEKSENINSDNNRTKNEQLTWDETDTHNEKGSKNFAYQDLIQKELKLRNFSIYNWISEKYAHELFLLVY
jgi:hypothetical protein